MLKESQVARDTQIIMHYRVSDPWDLKRPNTWPEVPALWDHSRYVSELVPEILRLGGIQKDKLELAETYLGVCRNAGRAVWTGEGFMYTRYKFGSTYTETIPHFQDDPGDWSDVFLPVMRDNSTEIAFRTELQKMSLRGWDKLYVLVDVHDTIFKASYDRTEAKPWFLGCSRKVLQRLTSDPRFVLILWTSTWPDKISEYLKIFEDSGIKFDYVNSNPEVLSNGLSCFDGKPYFNIILDDKAGFQAERDWMIIDRILSEKS